MGKGNAFKKYNCETEIISQFQGSYFCFPAIYIADGQGNCVKWKGTMPQGM